MAQGTLWRCRRLGCQRDRPARDAARAHERRAAAGTARREGNGEGDSEAKAKTKKKRRRGKSAGEGREGEEGG